MTRKTRESVLLDLQKTLSNRAMRSLYAYSIALGLIYILIALRIYDELILQEVNATAGTPRITATLLMIAFTDTVAMHIRRRYGFVIPLERVRVFPLSSAALYRFFLIIFLRDGRLLGYLLLAIALCFLLAKQSTMLVAILYAGAMVTFVLALESWHMNFYLAIRKLSKDKQDRIGLVFLPIFVFIGAVSNAPNILAHVPILSWPALIFSSFASRDFISGTAVVLILALFLGLGVWNGSRIISRSDH